MLNTALAGEGAAVLNVTAAELLSDAVPVAGVIGAALDREGVGVMGHWMVHELVRRSGLHDDLLNSIASPNPLTRAGAARICGALRLTDSVLWIADLVEDKNPAVRIAAVMALGQHGSRRAVDALVAASETIPLHRLAIALARAESEVDVEALVRNPQNEKVAVATVLATGLRRDVLRVPALLGIAHDRRWPAQVRQAACKALAMIGSRAAADGLARLGETEPEASVKAAASRSHKRLLRRAVSRQA